MHICARSPGRSRQVPMPCSSSTVQAGTDQQNWKCQTTSPCSNSRPMRQNSTRWKTFGPTCAPTSWQSLCLNPTMRLSTNAAMPGISSQRTNRQSHQLHHVIGPKQSINRAVGITPSSCPGFRLACVVCFLFRIQRVIRIPLHVFEMCNPLPGRRSL